VFNSTVAEGTPFPKGPPKSSEDRIGVGGSSDGQDEQGRIILPSETKEQPALSSGLSAMPWLNRRRPGSLYSIIEYEDLQLLHLVLSAE
jgi:hypothetical protein